MKIKREILGGLNSLAFLVSGLFLIVFLFEELSRIGTIAYIFLWLFMVSSFLLWKHERLKTADDKLINKIVEDIVQDYEDQFKNIPSVVEQEIKSRELHKEGFLDQQHFKYSLKEHLLDKSKNEKIKLDAKIIKGFLFELVLVTIVFGAIVAFFSPK